MKRSPRRLGDVLLVVLFVAFLIVATLAAWRICALHAKEHGHDGPAPLFGVEPVQGGEAQGQGSGHASHGAHPLGAGA